MLRQQVSSTEFFRHGFQNFYDSRNYTAFLTGDKDKFRRSKCCWRSSNKRQKTIGSLVRKAIKAVQPGVRGKCVNNSWAKSVTVARLKTQTAISLVGDREFFSLEDFLPWAKMNLKCFNSGPRTLDYLIPVTSWEAFQVIK